QQTSRRRGDHPGRRRVLRPLPPPRKRRRDHRRRHRERRLLDDRRLPRHDGLTLATERDRVKTKIAHYGEWGAMGVAVPTCVATTATPSLPDSLATVTYVAAWLGVAVGLGALTISALWHRGLCEACITAVPLNAPQLGARYRRQFAVIHALTGTRTRVTVGAL